MMPRETSEGLDLLIEERGNSLEDLSGSFKLQLGKLESRAFGRPIETRVLGVSLDIK